VAEREAEDRVFPIARDRGVAVIVNRPFAEGGLLRRLGARPVPSFAAEIGCTTWAQLLLKFIVSHPAVTCAIPATSDAEHLRSNMRAGEGAMPDEAMRRRIVEAASDT
jgi:aryl-alcohol dehydrogenase-like predicted oxidoreductase